MNKIISKFRILNRPISPHLSIYSSQFSSISSIWHRITGVLLILIIFLFVIIFKMSLYITFNYFFYIVFKIIQNSVFTLWIQKFFYLYILLILVYHGINGLRHIMWDLNFLFYIKNLNYFYILFSFLLLPIVITNFVIK